MTARSKIWLDARNRRDRLFRREKRAVRLFREQRLLGTLLAFTPGSTVTVVPLCDLLAVADREAAREAARVEEAP